jgi:hypothetical protein
MTACSDLYKKWKVEPNFCGLGKVEANYIDKYISFVEEFAKQFDIPEDVVYRNAPRSAVKPILRFRKDSAVRQAAVQAVADTLKGKHSVTSKFVNANIGVQLKPQKMVEAPKVIVAPISEPHRLQIDSNNIKDKMRLITSVLTTGQMMVLTNVMIFAELDNEYEALSLIIKWAAERIGK